MKLSQSAIPTAYLSRPSRLLHLSLLSPNTPDDVHLAFTSAKPNQDNQYVLIPHPNNDHRLKVCHCSTHMCAVDYGGLGLAGI